MMDIRTIKICPICNGFMKIEDPSTYYIKACMNNFCFHMGSNVKNFNILWLTYKFDDYAININFDIPNTKISKDNRTILKTEFAMQITDLYDLEYIKNQIKLLLTFQ